MTVSVNSVANQGTGNVVYGSADVSSNGDPATSFAISAVLPPGTAGVFLRYEATTAANTATYDGTGDAVFRLGELARHIYVDTTGFTGNLAAGDNSVQKVAEKFDDFTASGGGTPAANSITPAMLLATTSTQKQAMRTRIGATGYVATATQTISNIDIPSGGTNPRTSTAFAVDLSEFAPNFQLGYDSWTLHISGNIVATTVDGHNGLFDLYFQATGFYHSSERYYLKRDGGIQTTITSFSESVEVPHTVATGSLYLVRKSGSTGEVDLSGTLTAQTPTERPHFTGYGEEWSFAIQSRTYTTDSVQGQPAKFRRWGNLVYYYGNFNFTRTVGSQHEMNMALTLPYAPTGKTVDAYQAGVIEANTAFSSKQVYTSGRTLVVKFNPVTTAAVTFFATISGWYFVND